MHDVLLANSSNITHLTSDFSVVNSNLNTMFGIGIDADINSRFRNEPMFRYTVNTDSAFIDERERGKPKVHDVLLAKDPHTVPRYHVHLGEFQLLLKSTADPLLR